MVNGEEFDRVWGVGWGAAAHSMAHSDMVGDIDVEEACDEAKSVGGIQDTQGTFVEAALEWEIFFLVQTMNLHAFEEDILLAEAYEEFPGVEAEELAPAGLEDRAGNAAD